MTNIDDRVVNAAAKNGLTEVLRNLLHTVARLDVYLYGDTSFGLEYAAAAGYSDIVALLLEHGQTSVGTSMEKAAEAGHMKIVFMLLPRCDGAVSNRAVAPVVTHNRDVLAEFLVRFCLPYEVEQVAKTANNVQRELLKLQLAKQASYRCLDLADELAYVRFVSAAACGNEQVVKALMHQFFSISAAHIGYVVEVAAALSQCGVVKIIFDKFASRNLRVPDFVGIKPALQRALESNDLVMARLLTRSCDRFTAGIMLNNYGLKYQVEAVKVLAERSYQYDIAAAAFETCMAGPEDVFSVLMEFMQETTVREISVKLANAGKLDTAKHVLMNKCNAEKLFAEAIANGTTELVKLLLGEMSGSLIRFALLTAARFGHIGVVKLLLGNRELWDTHFHALEEAAKAGHANVVDYLRQWCGPARITRVIADLRAAGEEGAVALLDTKRARLE